MSAAGRHTSGRAGRSWSISRSPAILVFVNLVLYMCYFVHLRADFPNGSPWNDWAKFTDEGWYGGAALHRALTGQWYVPGGFNPAVGLPAWPVLLAGWFSVFGAGIVAARVLAVLLLGGSLIFMHRLLRPVCGTYFSLAATALVLVNPFVFSFQRLAILEPLIVFLFTLALWCATVTGSSHTPRSRQVPLVVGAILTGALIAGLVLSKTTAVVLAPAVLYQMWAAAVLPGWMHNAAPELETRQEPSLRRLPRFVRRDRSALWPPAVAAITALLLWCLWFSLLVRPHYVADYRQLFAINNDHAHGRILLQVTARAVGDATWIQSILVPLALLVIAVSFRFLRELWRTPLFGASVLALAGSIGFIGWHTWFQPRYYLVCVLPFAMVLAMGLRAVQSRMCRPAGKPWRVVHHVSLFALAVAAALMLVQTAGYLLHPRYTMLSAARSIAALVRGDALHPQVLMASSADDISLLTGMRSVNPEWPLDGLPALVRHTQPGWYAAYTPWDNKHIEEVSTLYRMHEAARFQVFDDPDHRALILYRLDAPR